MYGLLGRRRRLWGRGGAGSGGRRVRWGRSCRVRSREQWSVNGKLCCGLGGFEVFSKDWIRNRCPEAPSPSITRHTNLCRCGIQHCRQQRNLIMAVLGHQERYSLPTRKKMKLTVLDLYTASCAFHPARLHLSATGTGTAGFYRWSSLHRYRRL